MKKEYYGLKNNELLGYNFGRQETYFFRIYNDGSSTVMIRTKDNIAGDLPRLFVLLLVHLWRFDSVRWLFPWLYAARVKMIV